MENRMRHAIVKDHFKKQLNEVEAQICLIKARAEKMGMDGTADYRDWLTELGRARDELNRHLERMDGAIGDEWEKLKLSAEHALKDIRGVISRGFPWIQ